MGLHGRVHPVRRLHEWYRDHHFSGLASLFRSSFGTQRNHFSTLTLRSVLVLLADGHLSQLHGDTSASFLQLPGIAVLL